MTRPITVIEWATDANYPADAAPEQGSPTKIALSLGQATIGWRPGGIPPAQEWNTLHNHHGTWLKYLQSITEPKWKWLPAGAGQYGNTTTSYGDFVPQGFFGESGQINTCSLSVDLPEGARILKLGIRYRHAAGEPSGGVIGSAWLLRLDAPANGVNSANSVVYIPSDPAQAINPTINAIEIIGNNAAGANWETVEVDLDQTGDLTVVTVGGQVSFVLAGTVSGVGEIESMGYQYQLEE